MMNGVQGGIRGGTYDVSILSVLQHTVTVNAVSGADTRQRYNV